MFKPNGAFPTFTVPAGYSVKYSFKLKLAQALTSGHLSVQTVVKSGGSTDYPNIGIQHLTTPKQKNGRIFLLCIRIQEIVM